MDKVGSAKLQFSNIENGLEQSKTGIGILSNILKAKSDGRD